MRSILTIAGFDTSGGAGLHADIKTAKKLNFHVCSVITAITFQNTCKISDLQILSESALEKQLEAVEEDVKFSAIKIGMVPEIITARVIHKFLRDKDIPKVLDPVLKSSTGFKIGDSKAYRILMDEIDVITPNVSEAQEMSGVYIKDFNSAKKAAMKISDGFSVVITGSGDADVVYDAEKMEFYKIGKRINAKEVHGTGCVYSTALACYLADGFDLILACKKARRFVLRAAKKAVKVGKCLPVANP